MRRNILTRNFIEDKLGSDRFTKYEWETEKAGTVSFPSIGAIYLSSKEHLEGVVSQSEEIFKQWEKENDKGKLGF